MTRGNKLFLTGLAAMLASVGTWQVTLAASSNSPTPSQPNSSSQATSPQATSSGAAPPQATPSQATSSSSQAAASQTATANSAVDPDAVAALYKMGDYLRTLTSFEVRSDTTTDAVLSNDQKVQLGGTVDYKVRRPNAFAITVDSDRKQRNFFYDGKTFTIYAPRMGFFTTLPAPSTISELFKTVYNKYNVQLPLEDLFHWGQPDDQHNLKSGGIVGYAKLNGVDTDQYAFREGDIDWQIWIQRGSQPLPLKVVIVKTSDSTMPQYSSTLHWNTNISFPDTTFAFKPPPNSKPIIIATTKAN